MGNRWGVSRKGIGSRALDFASGLVASVCSFGKTHRALLPPEQTDNRSNLILSIRNASKTLPLQWRPSANFWLRNLCIICLLACSSTATYATCKGAPFNFILTLLINEPSNQVHHNACAELGGSYRIETGSNPVLWCVDSTATQEGVQTLGGGAPGLIIGALYYESIDPSLTLHPTLQSCQNQCATGTQFSTLTNACEAVSFFSTARASKDPCGEGNPCSPVTGNKFQTETDLSMDSVGLSIRRYYQSQALGDGYIGMGQGWRHNFTPRLDSYEDAPAYSGYAETKSQLYTSDIQACLSGWDDIKTDAYRGRLTTNTLAFYRRGICEVEQNGELAVTLPLQSTEEFTYAQSTTVKTVSRPNGDVITFKEDNGWIPINKSEVSLVKIANDWGFTDTDDTVEIYGADGSLQTSTTRNDWITAFTYDGSGRLDTVTGPFSHVLTFSYDAQDRVDAITTPLGDILYGYDANNNLDTVTYPDGRIKQYHYEDVAFPNHLTGITDENTKRYATWAYDAQGRATLSEHAGGVERVTLAYNANSSTTVTDSRGNIRTYDFTVTGGELAVDDVNGIPCSTCSNGKMKDRTYDANGYLASSSDWQDIITKYGQYDPKGQYGCKVEGVRALDASTGACAFDLAASPNARRTDYIYDSRFFNRITSMTERSVKTGSDKVTTNTFNAFGNRLSETISGFDVLGNPVARTTTYEYNGPLNQLSQVDGPRTNASDITQYRYYANDALEGNNRARLKEIEDANGVLMRAAIQYTATGKVESESRPNGLSLDYVYLPGNDRLSTLTESSVDGSTHVTQWIYLATGEVASIITGVGTSSSTTLTLGYDDARRLTRITDGLGNYVDYGLDTEGNRETETTYDANGTPSNFADDVLKKQITQTFDVYNRLDTSSQANENQNLTFAPDGTLDTQTDGNGIVTDYSYDALKRLTQTIQDQGGTNTQTKDATTAYGYDVADRLTSVTDPINGNTTYQYDDLGNLLSQTSPDTGTTLYLYDNAGNLTQKTDAKGQVIIYSYDALNRLTNVDATGTEDDLTYTYDNCANGTNRLCTVQSATQTVHNTYDAFGEVTRSQGISRTYVADKLDTMTYPSGAQVSYTYDLAGQITQMDLIQNGMSETIVSNIQYAPLGPIKQLTWGNSQILTQTLDSAYRMTDKSTPGVLTFDTALFDPNGNLTTRNETVGANSVTSSTHSYDEINRLNSAAGTFGIQSLLYDKNGNRAQDTLNSQVTPYTYTPNSNRIDQINALPVSIDANGNTESQGSYTYHFTTHNRIETATENTTVKASFTYNGLGQRNHKINHQTNAEKHFFYGQAGELLAETDAHGNVLVEYIYLNGMQIAQHQPDSDGDGQTNAQEATLGTNPTNTDTDQDGLTDLYELLQTGTSTTEADTDGDGSNDQEEINQGTDPLNPDSTPVTNPPATPVAAPSLQTVALIGLSILFLGVGFILIKRGIHTPALFFIGVGLLCIPNAHKQNSDDHPLIKSAHALPSVSGQLYFVHTDHLGTPHAMTDRSATVVWQATYTPFGKATVNEDPDNDGKVVENNIRAPGQYFDSETGLHDNGFRVYDPSSGRYVTSDPIGLAGGINTYAYVGGNPLRWTDSRGLDAPGCDGVPNFLESNCMLNMCAKHDYCYFENRCTASSWFIPLSKCNLRCNFPAVGGTIGAGAAAVLGIECEPQPDETPRETTCGK